jgi:hypothetical protein
MGLELPIFFIPVDPGDRAWSREDAEQLIGDAYDTEREKTGVRSSASRGGWHLRNVRQAASTLKLSALDFLERDLARLDTGEIAQAIQALSAILAEASSGASDLATTCTAAANEFFVQIQRADTDANPKEAYARAFLEAQPTYDVEWSGDAGYGAIVGYFAFLKTLLVCLVECLNSGKHLLYYRAQA